MNRCSTIVIAGYGTIGRAFCQLARPTLLSYAHVIIIDRCRIEGIALSNAQCFQGDIEDVNFLVQLLHRHKGSFIFINLCAFTDNYIVRQTISRLDGAYIDTACSAIANVSECRYSRLMPHTFRPTQNQAPHLVCCGVNPGLIELVVRSVAHTYFTGDSVIDVFIYEHDGLRSVRSDGRFAVSWSADALVDEVMRSPTIYLRSGRVVEAENAPAHFNSALWNGKPVEARLIGHEELWNLTLADGPRVDNARCSYAMDRSVMSILSGPCAESALKKIAVTDGYTKVIGQDTIAVNLVGKRSRRSMTFAWVTDHAVTQQQWGLNAVQFQVASCILLFHDLLYQAPDSLVGKVTCASTLPVKDLAWEHFSVILDQYGIAWKETRNLTLAVSDSTIVRSSTGMPCSVGPSKIDGTGVFATAAISRGTAVSRIGGDIYSAEEFRRMYNASEDRFVQVGENAYLGPPRGPITAFCIDDYLNHSCEPNCGIFQDGDSLVFVSLRDIPPGEELTWDYSTSIDDDDEPLTCRCRSRACRGKIEPFRYLPPSVKHKYKELGIVLTFIAGKYGQE